jgi:accessory gene regulator protein AgrB
MGTNYAPLLSNFFYAPMGLSLYKKISKTKKVERLKPLISLPGILMMFCQLIIRTLLTGFHYKRFLDN